MIDFFEDKVQDECGVYGIYSNDTSDLKYDVYYGLYALQHRGQESAGIAISYANNIECYKNEGLVSSVFTPDILDSMKEGDIALGHVRYGSIKFSNVVNAQPMVFTGKSGMFSVAMNGKIVNANSLRKSLRNEGYLFQTESDVEVIAALLNKHTENNKIFEGLQKAIEIFKGSFSVIVMTSNSLIAARDKFGLKPLIFGKKYDDYHISSESCALEAVDVEVIRDIEPGEIIEINSAGVRSEFMENIPERRPCVFEYIYTARADSIIDNKSVYKARYDCGVVLAKKLKIKADIVAGVPDSANVAARGYAEQSGIPFIDVLEKNRYVARTFIQPTQAMRESAIKVKLNAHSANIKDKSLILIDDSIVRGTTSKKIVDLLRKHGAREVHLVIASPVLANPCYTGIDIESRSQLMGANLSVKEMCEIIGADSLNFMNINDLVDCCKTKNHKTFCTACFDGNYPEDIENVSRDEKEVIF